MDARRRSPTQLPTPQVALEALVVWFALGTIYLLTLAGNHTEAEDALRYLYDIRSGDAEAISNSYHLAYGWYGWLGYHVALLLGYGGGPLFPVQVLNALTGALGIAVLWVLLRRIVPGRAAAAGCGLLAFSYGYWWYSVEVEVYILSALLLICSLSLAYRAATNPSWRSFALLGATHGLAVLAHNTNVLFVAVTAVALLYASRPLPPRGAARLVAAYAAAGFVVVAPAYVLAIAASGLQTPEEVHGWLFPAEGAPYGVWGPSNAPKALVGMGRALVGGHFAFSLDPVHETVVGGFSDKSLREELFLVRDFPGWLALLLAAFVVVLAIAFLLHVLAWLLGGASLDERGRLLALLCAAWLAPYVPFFTWWEPQNIEFWIAPWVPLAVLFALVFSTRGQRPRRRFALPHPAGIFVVVLLCVNLWGSVWPQHDPKDDYWRVRTSWYEHNASPSDLGVTAGALAERYVRYFGPREVIDAETVFPKHASTADAISALRTRLNGADARRVLFSDEAFYPASDRFSRCTNTRLCDEWAPAMREEFLPCARVLNDEPLKEVWMLERHERRSSCGPA